MMSSLIVGSDQFACGVVRYSDHYGDETEPRLVIPIKYDNRELSLAIVDTGAPWCVISPEIADNLDIDPLPGIASIVYLASGALVTAGGCVVFLCISKHLKGKGLMLKQQLLFLICRQVRLGPTLTLPVWMVFFLEFASPSPQPKTCFILVHYQNDETILQSPNDLAIEDRS